MKSVKWSPELFLAPNGKQQQVAVGRMVADQRGEKVNVQIRRAACHRVLSRSDDSCVSKAQLREGCIKSVERDIWAFPQRARVLSEIHRRFDRVVEGDWSSTSWRARVMAIYDFAGAWAVAARLMQGGLRVAVVEEARISEETDRVASSGVDVELIIPSQPETNA